MMPRSVRFLAIGFGWVCLACDPHTPEVCGTVTRCDTAERLTGVKITWHPNCRGGDDNEYSNPDGKYCAYVCRDADLVFEKPGYATKRENISRSTSTHDECLEVSE
jgi:hypothetical protein